MKKPLAAGVSKKSPKAGPVDAKGAYTKVQERTLGNMKDGGKIKKAESGITEGPGPKTTPDSSGYYKKQRNLAAKEMANATTSVGLTVGSNKIAQANKNLNRQKLKGKPGYDANGFPIKKNKTGGKTTKSMKMGGKMMSKMSKKK